MPTFRSFMAVGVGTAIALFYMKPSVSLEMDHQDETIPHPALDVSTVSPVSTPQNPPHEGVISHPDTQPPVSPTVEDHRPKTTIVQSPEPELSIPTLEETTPPSPQLTIPSTESVPPPDSTPTSPSAPEFLNPSANPLLFPTQTEEVQIQTTQPITLEQAIELSERNNQQLEAARLTLQRTEYALQEALAAEFPSISAIGEFIRSESAQAELSNRQPSPLEDLLGIMRSTDTTSTTFEGRLELNYNAYTSGRRSATIQASREQVRLQQLEVERLSEELRLNVTRAYYDLQQADAQVQISQAAVTDAARSLRDAQLLEQAGLGTRFEVLQAQVELANNNQDLTNAISQQRIARRQIAQLLSLPQKVEVAAADPIQVRGDWDLSLEESIILALKNRSELEQQLVQRNISEQQRRIALAAIRPQVSVFATYNVLSELDLNDAPGDGATLGARVQWNFFDGGAAQARARQEETNMAIAETNFADQRNQVRFQVEQAFFELKANEENIQTATLAQQQAQESLRLARLRFQAGVGTQTDVINQQTALTRARSNLLTAILDYNRALATLQRAISNLPDSHLFDLP